MNLTTNILSGPSVVNEEMISPINNQNDMFLFSPLRTFPARKTRTVSQDIPFRTHGLVRWRINETSGQGDSSLARRLACRIPGWYTVLTARSGKES